MEIILQYGAKSLYIFPYSTTLDFGVSSTIFKLYTRYTPDL